MANTGLPFLPWIIERCTKIGLGFMVAPDITSIYVVGFFLAFYIPTITTIFVYQRWKLGNLTTNRKIVLLTITFLAAFGLLLLLFDLLGHEYEIWAFLYALTLTIITIGDRIAERTKARRNGQL
jgi:hypothetical protein